MSRHSNILIIILLALLTSGCLDWSRPDNPEPTIEIADAYAITRTGATVKCLIDHHGSSALSYATLHYRDVSVASDDELTIEADPSLATFEVHLSDLRPNATYSCHLEAGTATARLKSNSITFTTFPNTIPKVSGITPISTGPLGIILSFSILDDGGMSIIEAGCVLQEAESRESQRIHVSKTRPISGRLQLSITGLTPESSFIITPFVSNPLGEALGEPFEFTTSSSIVVTSPGTLIDLFSSDEQIHFESIAIAGPMNGDDFRALIAMLGAPIENPTHTTLSAIDLTDANVVVGGGTYDGQHFTETNRLTTGILSDCKSLRYVTFPNSVIEIERDAVARCPTLNAITLGANVKTLLPSAECSALETIAVSKANPNFVSDDGVLLNGDASEIVWFPCGKTNEYLFPSTISSIGENAFAETSITSLIIPSSVTSISRGAFAGSALKDIIMQDNITNIPERMFQNCTSLTTVRIGSGIEYVGDFAFDGTDLSDLFIGADYPPYTTPEAFSNRKKQLTEECTLHVPEGSAKLYRNHKKWGEFKTIVEFQP